MKRRIVLAAKIVLTAVTLTAVLLGFFWPRFKQIEVNDPEGEVNRNHTVEKYFDDDKDRYVEFSWYIDDLSESFLAQAASWEALDVDQRGVIKITSSREPCKE